MATVAELEARILQLERQNQVLEKKLADTGSTASAAGSTAGSANATSSDTQRSTWDSTTTVVNGLSLEEYKRYGRQMIVPELGALEGQKKLKALSVLVVGAGGLGCPALLYIAGAGVGKIGIVDSDTVDVSNLHRQVLHTTESVGMPKAESARNYIAKLNPNVEVVTHLCMVSSDNAFELIAQYDLVLDCTDNPATRYLINDVSVLCGKTIVSGSGLKTDGQLSILNFDGMGPCYRCFYPKPPPPNSVTSCKDGGVLGPCIGVVGVTMAVEALKVLTGAYTKDNFRPFLSIYSAYPQQSVRVFKMRPRQRQCAVCGTTPVISQEMIEAGSLDYAAFCGTLDSNVLAADERVSVTEYAAIRQDASNKHILLDVRPREQFLITALPGSVHLPWDPVMAKTDSVDEYFPGFDKQNDRIYVVCRYGNDSQLAARKLIDLGYKNTKDVRGGLNKWSEEVDVNTPVY